MLLTRNKTVVDYSETPPYFHPVPREAGTANLKIVYLELPAQQLAASKTFYANLFGWTFQDYGPTYAAFTESGTAGGLNADPAERTKAPLPVIESQNLEQTQQEILKAGGKSRCLSSAFLAVAASTSLTPQETN
jgi:predicted enzyme related to lactoylglutathione lyase